MNALPPDVKCLRTCSVCMREQERCLWLGEVLVAGRGVSDGLALCWDGLSLNNPHLVLPFFCHLCGGQVRGGACYGSFSERCF